MCIENVSSSILPCPSRSKRHEARSKRIEDRGRNPGQFIKKPLQIQTKVI
jgi:hypothetical protein